MSWAFYNFLSFVKYHLVEMSEVTNEKLKKMLWQKKNFNSKCIIATFKLPRVRVNFVLEVNAIALASHPSFITIVP